MEAKDAKVKDFMRPGVLTCRKDTRIGQVAVMLDQHRVHSLMVTDRDGRIVGVITDFDLLAGEWLSQDPQSLEVMRSLTAGDLMSSPVASIDANASIKEAAERMVKEDIRRLLVTDQGKPVGVISVSDIVAHIALSAPLGRGQVGDVMSDAYLVCRDKTPIASAARAMTSTGWRSVVVVDAKGTPLGVVSGLDLLPYCLEEDCSKKVVSEVMHPALTITIDATLQEAADMMIENHHHRLVVVDPEDPDSMPLGVISSFDIVALMAHPESVWQK
ncbi:MAG: CBS domain-containing protein [Anaerolineales bacterium]|nr:CBS domain-containing protein [Anaerolineales bacterium]MCS7248046.1 CBS domain-containing protein [Anaerolineales bacterium]MDW8161858.1 CBS domain-containing protein [Anaerolineales bacterium]MDW8447383.1 CBS domain-containing protein [Anaerolineales bacterium]